MASVLPLPPLPPPALTLLVPGLLWPNPVLQDTVFDLDLPALQTLLGRSRIKRSPLDENQWWAQQAGQPLAAAPLRRHALTQETDSRSWLCADPVHLRFEQQTLILDDPAQLSLSADESAALAATLVPLMAEFGALEVSAGQHWHLNVADALPPCPRLLSDLIGQNARALLPEGSEHRPWRRLFNEVQMALHQHPVNLARQGAGLPVINSLALWGGGSLPLSPSSKLPFSRILSDDLFHQGLARYWGLEAAPLPPSLGPTAGSSASHTLAVCRHLLRPTRQRNAMGWRDGLQALEEQWFAPALAALNQGHLRSFALTGFGEDDGHSTGLTALSHSRDKFKFWRPTRPLTELHP